MKTKAPFRVVNNLDDKYFFSLAAFSISYTSSNSCKKAGFVILHGQFFCVLRPAMKLQGPVFVQLFLLYFHSVYDSFTESVDCETASRNCALLIENREKM